MTVAAVSNIGQTPDVVRATVTKKLPRGLFLVTTDSGRQLTASLSSAARRLTVRVIPGELVMVRPSEFNPTRGQIVQGQPCVQKTESQG